MELQTCPVSLIKADAIPRRGPLLSQDARRQPKRQFPRAASGRVTGAGWRPHHRDVVEHHTAAFATYGSYAATKCAQEMLVNVLAKELDGRRFSVNAMAPELVNTRLFTDVGCRSRLLVLRNACRTSGWGEPSDIANVISAWLRRRRGLN